MGRLIRRMIGLVLGLAMVSSATWLGYEELFAANYINFRIVAVTLFLFLMGGWILWAGFLFPSPGKNSGSQRTGANDA